MEVATGVAMFRGGRNGGHGVHHCQLSRTFCQQLSVLPQPPIYLVRWIERETDMTEESVNVCCICVYIEPPVTSF